MGFSIRAIKSAEPGRTAIGGVYNAERFVDLQLETRTTCEKLGSKVA